MAMQPPEAIGRASEVSTLTTALDAAAGGRGATWLVKGEAGIGKTTIVNAIAAAAGARDEPVLVVRGRAWEEGGAPAYWPWIEVLRATTAQTDIEGPETRNLLSALVPELSAAAARIDTDEARFALFDAVWRHLAAVAARAGLVVVLEDLHAADPATAALTTFLAQRMPGAPILLLGTVRTPSVVGSASTPALLDALGREASTLMVGAVDDASARAIAVAAATTALPDDAVDAIVGASGGNPLLITELTRGVQARGGAAVAGGSLPVPEVVRRAIASRLDALEERSLEILRAAAVIGRDGDHDMLARAVDLDDRELAAGLAELDAQQLLRAGDDGRGRWAFTHGVVREVAYGSLDASTRRSLHLRIAQAIQAAPDDQASDDVPLVAIAHHLRAALPEADPAEAFAYAARAAMRTYDVLAFEAAVPQFEQALALARDAGAGDRESLPLAVAHADSLLKLGQIEAAERVARGVVERARAAQLPEVLARAACVVGSIIPEPGTVVAERVALLREALAGLDTADGDTRALTLTRLSTQLYFAPDVDERRSIADEALLMARRAGSKMTLAKALQGAAAAYHGPDHLEHALALATEGAVVAREARHLEFIGFNLARKASIELELARAAAFRSTVDELLALAAETSLPIVTWFAAAAQAMLLLMRGDMPGAEVVAEDALQRHPHIAMAPGARSAIAYPIARERGRIEEVEPLYRLVAEMRPGVAAPYRAGLVFAHVEMGRFEAAAVELRLAVAELDNTPRDSTWSAGVSFLAESAFRLGDQDSARSLRSRLLPMSGRTMNVCMVAPVVYMWPIDHYLGLCAATIGDHVEAARHFERAIEINVELGAPLPLARTAFEYARLLQAGGDHARAERLFDEAAQTAHAFGMTRLVEEIEDARQVGAAAPDVEDVFVPDGDVWRVTFDGREATFAHAKGFTYLWHLLRNPEREIPVLDLVRAVEGLAGAPTAANRGLDVLDDAAKRAYRRRIEELRAEIDDADTCNDIARAEKARAELDFVVSELEGALGLGARDRTTGDDAERARTSVTKVIRRALTRIDAHDPALGAHFRATIRTGVVCTYTSQLTPVRRWRLEQG